MFGDSLHKYIIFGIRASFILAWNRPLHAPNHPNTFLKHIPQISPNIYRITRWVQVRAWMKSLRQSWRIIILS